MNAGTRVPTATETRSTVIAMAVVFGLVVAFLPFAMLLDSAMDRRRPMYAHVHTMDVLQYQQMQQTGHGLPVVLHGDETATVGGSRFSPSPGVAIRVRLSDDGYCVQGRNAHGDVTEWRCGDGQRNPEKSP